ncbi:peptidyl-tRNA hydrolase ICT1, mitochondrial [Bombyx mandarina]|uniref:Large ribosomal subunit protein mL62 n=2 Tax=Bombyx TaxID=7090 RepID=A0A8R1WLX2_BOMMO|nr:peptidyl-tRNA hydrolase ICT1, mitochondrial [Bombyx mori]XP_028032319.1 peptidyl-tRNA hydrolase ICT1, mitochondrial [Bombyx mandarina]
MTLATLRLNFIRGLIKNATCTALLQRPLGYKSSISLETLYPNSSLKLTTPAFKPDGNEKFSGFIPIQKLDISYSASSGPGGQNVNKVHTKVDLRFKLSDADWIHPDIRQRMLELYDKKLTKEGYLIIKSDCTRSQQLNLADCMRKLRNMIRDAEVTKREPSPETQERIRQRQLKAARLRVAIKREDSLKRSLKQPPTVVDL